MTTTLRPAYMVEPEMLSAKMLADRWGLRLPKAYAVMKRLPCTKIDGEFQVPIAAVRAFDATWTASPRVRKLAQIIVGTSFKKEQDGGFVYFMQCRELVKIGYSRSPTSRWVTIQDAMPFEVVLLGYLSASLQAEYSLHNWFRFERVHREWFRLSDELRQAILLITKGSVEGHG